MSEVYREGFWRVCHDRNDLIVVQRRFLCIWTTWTEPVGHDTWLTVAFADYEAAIRFIQIMVA